MSKKAALIKAILDSLSEEDLEKILDSTNEEEEKKENTNYHTIRRRGSGYNKAKNKAKKEPNRSGNKKSGSRFNGRGKDNGRVEQMELSNKRENKFRPEKYIRLMSQSERKEFQEAVKDDKEVKELYEKGLVKKDFRNNHLIDVVCTVCGKEETVSSSIVFKKNTYKCNDCCCVR